MGITLIMSGEEAQEQFDEALEELQSAWNAALVCAGNPDELKAEQHELVLAVELLETAVEAVRGEMDEKIAEKDDLMEKCEAFEEAKADLEALCDRLGIENGELQVIRNKIEEECAALEIENGNFADLVNEAESKKEERDALNAEKVELELRQTELESIHDAEDKAHRKLLKKYKKLIKKKKKLELALEIIMTDSDSD